MEREYIRNEWMLTHHTDPTCRGLRASEAPTVNVRLSEEDLSFVKLCGYCGRVKK